MIDYLKFLPGYQDGMLKRVSEIYELIFKILTKATGKNKFVKLKTKLVERFPVHDLVTWWAVVNEIFQPTEAQI